MIDDAPPVLWHVAPVPGLSPSLEAISAAEAEALEGVRTKATAAGLVVLTYETEVSRRAGQRVVVVTAEVAPPVLP